jgi:hypothetical protein
MLTATVEHWDPQGFGFARATNGRTFYFTVPGYVNGHFTGNMAKGRMIDIIEEQPTKGYPCPTAWKWNLLREAPVVVVAKQAVSPVVTKRGIWHMHGVITRDFGILPVGETAPLGCHVQGYCQFDGDNYSRTTLGCLPEIGESVVILQTRNLTRRNQETGEYEETGEIGARKWCLLEDFPENLCGDDFKRPKEQIEDEQIEDDEKNFRIILTESDVVVRASASLSEATDFIDRANNGEINNDMELELACGYYRIEERTPDGWTTVSNGQDLALAISA